MTAEGTATEPNEATAQEDSMIVSEPVWSNGLGWSDGQKFYLTHFPIWSRTRKVASMKHNFDKLPESGVVGGVQFAQTLGRMELRYPLTGTETNYTAEDLDLKLSCWEIQVDIVGAGKKKINALCNELQGDIKLDTSWWELEEWEGGEKAIFVSLAKVEHLAWANPWNTQALHPHKRNQFGWSDNQEKRAKKSDEEVLQSKPCGWPSDMEKIMVTGINPSRICTGFETGAEDDMTISLFVYLDDEALDVASSLVPIEEIFSATVDTETVEVFLRFDQYLLCWGRLEGFIVPEETTWELQEVRREPPAKAGIKCPAYFCKALRINMVKAQQSIGKWEKLFAETQHPEFKMPRERKQWADMLQRAMVLSPAAPLVAQRKIDAAKKVCTGIEMHQDNYRAYISLHLEGRLYAAGAKFKQDLQTFFTLKLGEKVMEVIIDADAAYTMLMGVLGGSITPEKASWEFAHVEKSSQEEAPHAIMKIELPKAPGSSGLWQGEIFKQLERWEINHLSITGELPSEEQEIEDEKEEH